MCSGASSAVCSVVERCDWCVSMSSGASGVQRCVAAQAVWSGVEHRERCVAVCSGVSNVEWYVVLSSSASGGFGVLVPCPASPYPAL